jgi:hypothetical protein
MTDPTPRVPAVLRVPDLMARQPGTIAEALELHARLDALSTWVDDRKRAVRGWVDDRAAARKAEDGAAPTWRLGADGTVLRTDPQPKPRVSVKETFARWYVEVLLEADPDVPSDDALVRFDDDVARHTVVSVRNGPSLLRLIGRLAEQASGHEMVDAAEALEELEDGLDVDVTWVLSADVLEGLLSGPAFADSDGRPRLTLSTTVAVDPADPSDVPVVDYDVVDRATGELVPGTVVAPPGNPQVQMKPSPDFKRRVAGELTDLLGPAALPS